MLALTTSPALALADTPAKPAPTKPAPKADTFPLPKDATVSKAMPGGGKIQAYEVPRGRDAVVTEVKALLAKGGFTITKDDKSPSGRAVRLEVTKGDKLYKVSFTGDDTRAAIILTNP